jgi:2-phospho-L-lactate/phosphoenolpyruvate guanylyltransferase
MRPHEVVAVIPVKPLKYALGRLIPVLGAPARRDLQWEMLGAVLAACVDARGLGRVIVVSGDPLVGGLARAFGAQVIADHRPPRGMNEAVVLGCDAARAAGADGALILTADLPLARARDLEQVIGCAPASPGAVCVPSREGTGTNALLLHGPRILDPQLGLGSLALHEEQARRRGIPMIRFHSDALALDIDTPDDLVVLCDFAPAWAEAAGMLDHAAAGGVR